MKCRLYGVGHTIELRAVGNRKIQVDMKMFPARASLKVSRDMLLFFMASYRETCQEIKGDGYTVVRGPLRSLFTKPVKCFRSTMAPITRMAAPAEADFRILECRRMRGGE